LADGLCRRDPGALIKAGMHGAANSATPKEESRVVKVEINAPTNTANNPIQGILVGGAGATVGAAGAEGGSCALIDDRVARVDPGDHGHAGAQPVEEAVGVVDHDFNGNPLNHLREIAVALSGGSSANCEPAPGAKASTWPRRR